MMTWDERIARFTPYVATAIAMFVTLYTFSAYFQY